MGLSEPPADAKGRCRFLTNFYGLRAGMCNLLVAESAHKCHTLTLLIHHWSKTDQAPYIAFVASETGLNAETEFKLAGNASLLKRLTHAMAGFEQGHIGFSDGDLQSATIAALNWKRQKDAKESANAEQQHNV